MAPAWRRLLAKHEGKTLVEICRRPRIKERIAGFVVGFSSELILLHRLDWNTFTLDGYTLLKNRDVKQMRCFTRASYWQLRAIQKLRLRPRRLSGIHLKNWAEAMDGVAKKFPVIHVEREIKYQNECWIGAPLEINSKQFEIDYLDPEAKWTGPYGMKTSDVTRVDFGGGYERALAMTAPKRPQSNQRLT